MNELGNTPADKDYKPSGISRAEEAALKAYPINIQATQLYGDWDINKTERDGFAKGYEQAEKDTMEQVVECELVCLKDRLLAVLPIKEFQWTAGDKIKIIIVKEGRHE